MPDTDETIPAPPPDPPPADGLLDGADAAGDISENVSGDAGGADGAPGATAPRAPLEYAFEAPEIDGRPVPVDEPALADFKAMARELDLTQDQFQGVAARGMARLQRLIAETATRQYGEWVREQARAQSDAWAEAARADPETGGERLAETLRLAARAMDRFGGPGFREDLRAANLQNYPPLVRALAAVGRAMGDVSGLSVGRPASAAAPRTAQEMAEAVYAHRDHP